MSLFESLGNADYQAMYNYIHPWPDGTEGYITFHKKGSPKSPEQLGYYYAVILPTAVEAFRRNQDYQLYLEHKDKKVKLELTLKNADTFMKLRYAAMTGEYKDKEDMNMAECSAFEDWCIKWLATWLNCQIPPADRNWRDKLESSTKNQERHE